MSREQALDILRAQYPHLASEYGVKRIGLFGSCAGDALAETSDVDVVVEFERPIGLRFVEFTEFLEGLFGRKVDVLTQAGLHGIRIPHVAEEIEKSLVYV
jgi:hypothetical protein